jgi:transposase
MEIITGAERRRRWRDEDKLRIVAEAEAPGSVFALVARRHEILSRAIMEVARAGAAR